MADYDEYGDWRPKVDGLHKAMETLERIQGETEDDTVRRKLGVEIEDIRRQIHATGPYIPDSPGATIPAWMTDPDEIAEYRMSPEYANDLTYVPDYDPYE